ncbi:unnamed protein product [Amoebophrya sp. A25]|nr:unnamed protein product [Amoebophrya sp. A25]|eukprot:GSA25T00027234001.1
MAPQNYSWWKNNFLTLCDPFYWSIRVRVSTSAVSMVLLGFYWRNLHGHARTSNMIPTLQSHIVVNVIHNWLIIV